MSMEVTVGGFRALCSDAVSLACPPEFDLCMLDPFECGPRLAVDMTLPMFDWLCAGFDLMLLWLPP